MKLVVGLSLFFSALRVAHAGGALALSMGSIGSSGAATLNLTWSPQPSGASALQWTLQYPASAITSISAAAGPALTASGKNLSCVNRAGTYTCIAIGVNKNTIPAGVIARISAVPSGSSGASLTFSNTLGASSTGTAEAVTGSALTVPGVPVISQLSSLTCGAGSINGAGSLTCTVRLSGAAPSGGLTVALTDNGSYLTTPASTVIAAGSSVGTFTVTASAVPSTVTRVVTATLNGVSRSLSITLSPALPALTSLVCNPMSLNGPGTVACTVRLSGAAPSGGLRVALADSGTYLTTPSSTLIAAGSSTVAFTVTASAVSSTVTRTVTASLNGLSRSVSISLSPAAAPVLTSLTCNPTTIAPRASSTCSVTLNRPAPSGGATVTLSDSSANVTTPASVTIAQGSTSANFTINTAAVTATSSVTITAAYSGASRSVSLTLTASALPSLTSFQCAPTTLLPADAVTCSVRLSAAAPNGGVSVTLSDNSANLSLPQSVSVPSGSASATVTATVSAASSDQTVVVTATLNGVSKTASLTITGNALAGWWKLDETAGRMAADASGNGNHGALVGNPVWTGGVALGALQLNSSSHVQVSDSPLLRGEGRGISFGAWYFQNPAAAGYLLGKGSYILFLHQSSGRLGVSMSIGGISRLLWAMFPGGISKYNNTWVHVFATYDGAAMRAYVNGEEVASLPASGDLLGASDNLAIGDYSGSGSWIGFTGKIDDVRVYRRALSAAQVRTLYLTPGR